MVTITCRCRHHHRCGQLHILAWLNIWNRFAFWAFVPFAMQAMYRVCRWFYGRNKLNFPACLDRREKSQYLHVTQAYLYYICSSVEVPEVQYSWRRLNSIKVMLSTPVRNIQQKKRKRNLRERARSKKINMTFQRMGTLVPLSHNLLSGGKKPNDGL